MKALVYPAFDQIEIQEIPVPSPKPGELLIRVAAVGICGSELEQFASRSLRRPPPLIMGHEFCGQVAAVGAGIAHFQEGERVVVSSVIPCFACDLCRDGQTHLCPKREVFGMRRPGGFAEYVAVPVAVAFALPEKVSPLEGALVEPLANGVHVFSLVQSRFPETVVVFGAGTIGLLALQVAKALGAFRLVVVDTNPFRLEMAHELGAEPIINPRQEDVKEALSEFTRGRGVDVAIDAAGVAETRQTALSVTRPGGEVVWIGLHSDRTDLSGHEVVLGERKIMGSYAVTSRDIETAIGLFAHGKVELSPWVRPFPLTEGARVFRELLGQPSDYIKGVLLP
ncbi:MAG: alcohol dehydrogenase catalytic domain-containing protein [Candidatus Rokubacteria bacterium]|nr:alcohol dehydrogenase catalytic domain-containing protein [Candidatus Rokubacteria bacterium]